MRKLTKEEAWKYMQAHYDETRSKSWEKYLLQKSKQNYFILFDDGYVLECERPSISKTMYYDDELPAPSTDFESFMRYNINHHFDDYGVHDWIQCERDLKTNGCCIGYHDRMWLSFCYDNGNKTTVRLHTRRYNQTEPSEDKYFVRYLSDDEQNQFIEHLKIMRQEYEKRIKTYYKRYGEKVTTYGYWANR